MILCRLLTAPPDSSLVAAIAAIEAEQLPTPWGADSLADTLSQPGTLIAVAENEHRELSAYCLIQQVLDEATVLQIATARAQQRQGLAQTLLSLCLGSLRQSGCSTLWLEVRARNAAAIALYRQQGFAVQTIRKRYYPALPTGEAEDDGLVMCRKLARDDGPRSVS